MITTLQNMLPTIEAWPAEDQEVLADIARDIESGRTGVYHASAAELAGIDRGLADARAKRFAPDSAVAAVLAKFRNA